MIDVNNVSPVDPEELLARFVTQSSQFRGDKTIKQDLFVPHPYRDLSVTRHREATLEDIWQVGESLVASLHPPRTLYGRSDVEARNCTFDGLHVVAAPVAPSNPNHAEIRGWPADKADRKSLAQKIAATASKLILPPPA